MWEAPHRRLSTQPLAKWVRKSTMPSLDGLRSALLESIAGQELSIVGAGEVPALHENPGHGQTGQHIEG